MVQQKVCARKRQDAASDLDVLVIGNSSEEGAGSTSTSASNRSYRKSSLGSLFYL
jgi:hypothetical protein